MEAEKIAELIAGRIGTIKGVDAVVLGGSRATGTANASSDIDIGIYYNPEIDIDALKRLGTELDDEHRADCVTEIGEWGPWINGGGWLKVSGVAVDLLLRDTAKVARCIDDCKRGVITIDYQCGHPFGFVNSIYMGEAYYAKVLFSVTGKLEKLKAGLSEFPQTYRRAAIAKFMWESNFSIMCGRKAVAKGDVVYAAGSLFRAAICMVQALYAANGMYCINEKGSLHRLADAGAALPERFVWTVENSMRIDKGNMSAAFDTMEHMQSEVNEICAGVV